MDSPKCAVCGHINRVGAALCDVCESGLTGAAGPGAREGSDPSAGASGPSDSYAYDTYSYAGGAGPGGRPNDAAPPQHSVDVGDVMTKTLEVYRKNFGLVLVLVVVTTLPLALLQYAVTQAMQPADGAPLEIADGGFQLFFWASTLLAALLSFLGTTVLSASLIHAVFDLRRAGAAAAGDCLRRGLKALPKVFIVSLLCAVITGVGYLLLIVPGIILSLMLAVAVPAAIAEGRDPVESLRRSAELTKGHKGLIFLTYFLWGVLIIVINLIVTGSFAYASAQETLPAQLTQAFVGGVLNSSATVLTVYIYLGVLREGGRGFTTRAFTPEPAAR